MRINDDFITSEYKKVRVRKKMFHSEVGEPFKMNTHHVPLILEERSLLQRFRK